jgi:predicted CopG family antitoxin
MDKVKVQLDRDIVNKLLKMKEVGDTYSDVIRKLMKKAGV